MQLPLAYENFHLSLLVHVCMSHCGCCVALLGMCNLRLCLGMQLEGAMVLAGNTASGVYHEWPQAPVIVSIRHLPELTATKRSKVGLCPAL